MRQAVFLLRLNHVLFRHHTPPKSPAKSAKGKKGKLSKAEKERLKKEELELKAKEEEDARAKAEQEEKERLERERLEREERLRIEAAESQRHATEVSELQSILEGNEIALSNIHDERRAKAKWDRYMQCDGTPDPTIAAEVNTYINLSYEATDTNDIDSVILESKQTLALISELEFLLDDTPEKDLNESQAARYQDTINELQNLLSSKVDAATVLLLKAASSLADTESGNLQFVKSSSDFTLMLWGNLIKNPRFKSYEFEEENFIFELPKQLALSDIAIRVLRTQYDHYSHLCRTFHAKKKKKPSIVMEAVVHEDEDKKEKPEEAGKTEEEEGAVSAEEKQDGESDKEEQEEGFDETDEPKPPSPSRTPQQTQPAQPDPEEVEEEDEAEEEYDQEDEDTVDLRAYQVLGGVIHLDLLSLPPQPKQVKSWVMTQVSGNELKKVAYPAGDNRLGQTLSGTMTMGQTLDPKALANAAAATEALGAPPVGISFRLCEDVLYSEEPQMAYWCPERKQWRLDGFIDIKFNEETRILSFKTINFGPLACLQDKHINMPFQSWELRPIAVNHARFTVMAAIIEAEIEIKGSLCCFRQTPDSEIKPELNDLKEKWMTPKELIKAMKTVGVNLFPEDDSKKYVSIVEKTTVIEDAIYHQMALCASHFAFAWSKWNSEVGAEKVIVQGTQKLVDEAPQDNVDDDEKDEWSLLMVSKQRTMKLRVSEYDEEFSEDYADGSQFHADLYHMVCELSTEEGMDRMGNTDFRFVDAVYQLLSATRLLTYS
ncbi:axonemal 84 kDa protein-like isoform X2 [Acanthaster planci]|uniref:Axonemal 84 kDa protein-like isoform X2 n=1 Tax=Acanthaster planci TaxID=133434 RepID=A0A8B7ZT93_ACAPL|nr:axonemal 84 kDa protein-like isoform X2 [Acanthaster planci]